MRNNNLWTVNQPDPASRTQSMPTRQDTQSEEEKTLDPSVNSLGYQIVTKNLIKNPNP